MNSEHVASRWRRSGLFPRWGKILPAKEAAETEYWLEVMMEAEIVDSEDVMPLLKEANEFVRIFNRASRTSRDKAKDSGKRDGADD